MRIATLLSFLLLNLTSLAQDNYLDGYIVNLKGDTIQGQINQQDWFNTPNSVTFRTTSGEIQKLGTRDVQAFGVGNSVFRSVVTELEISSRNDASLDTNGKLILNEASIFIKAELIGPISLYSFKMNSVDHFFIVKDNQVEPLHYKRYIKVSNEKDYISENNRFQLQLNFFFGNACKAANERTKYALWSLRKAMLKYYDCIDFTPEIITTEKNKVTYGVFAGANYTSMPLNTALESFDILVTLSTRNINNGTYTSIDPIFGAFAELPLANRSSRLKVELSYYSFAARAVETNSSISQEMVSQIRYEDQLIRLGIYYKNKIGKIPNLSFSAGPIISGYLSNETKELQNITNLLTPGASEALHTDFDNFLDDPTYRPLVFGGQASVIYEINQFQIELKAARSLDFAKSTIVSASRLDFSLTGAWTF